MGPRWQQTFSFTSSSSNCLFVCLKSFLFCSQFVKVSEVKVDCWRVFFLFVFLFFFALVSTFRWLHWPLSTLKPAAHILMNCSCANKLLNFYFSKLVPLGGRWGFFFYVASQNLLDWGVTTRRTLHVFCVQKKKLYNKEWKINNSTYLCIMPMWSSFSC